MLVAESGRCSDSSDLTDLYLTVVSGPPSSKVTACRVLMTESAEARLGGMLAQSLSKQISTRRPIQGDRSLAFSNPGKVLHGALPSALSEIPSSLLSLENLQVATTSLSVWAFKKSILPRLPSSNWSLWWIEGPSNQWEERGVGLPHTSDKITHLL